MENLQRDNTQCILTELTLHNFAEDIPGLSNYVVDQFQYEVKLPAVVISVITLEKLHTWLSEGRNLTVRITSTGNNGKQIKFVINLFFQT
jgi:hypothetical protein